jgi:hypothetical protein
MGAPTVAWGRAMIEMAGAAGRCSDDNIRAGVTIEMATSVVRSWKTRVWQRPDWPLRASTTWTSAAGDNDSKYGAIAGNKAAKHNKEGAHIAACASGDEKWGVGINNTGNGKDATCGNNDSTKLAMKSTQFRQGRQCTTAEMSICIGP